MKFLHTRKDENRPNMINDRLTYVNIIIVLHCIWWWESFLSKVISWIVTQINNYNLHYFGNLNIVAFHVGLLFTDRLVSKLKCMWKKICWLYGFALL